MNLTKKGFENGEQRIHEHIHPELEHLPFLNKGVTLKGSDSHDVTGFNDDGFISTYSYLYKTDEGLVLFDYKGPGCIKLIRSIGFTGDMKVYIDGEEKPSVNVSFNEMYSGSHPDFPSHLVGHEAEAHGSSWCYVPIPFRKSCKIIATDKAESYHFYNIFAHAYSAGNNTVDSSWNICSGNELPEWTDSGLFSSSNPEMNITGSTVKVPSFGRVQLLEYNSGGTICWLRIKLPEDQKEHILEHLRIRAWWDMENSPNIDAPLGLFFAAGLSAFKPNDEISSCTVINGELTINIPLGRIAPKSAAVGELDDGSYYCHFPMPFWKKARIELVNYSADTFSIQYDLGISSKLYPEDSGYFCAYYRKEDGTLPHRDYVISSVRGTGRYVGSVLRMSSRVLADAPRMFLEGDARFYIDDSHSFFCASTGTEEYFNWGWYDMAPMDRVFTFPTHGYVEHVRDVEDHSTMYRLHLTDWVPYYRSFRFELEHGPEGITPSNYSSVSFHYHRNESTMILTDIIEIMDVESEKTHNYHVEGVIWSGKVLGIYEGNNQVLGKLLKDSYNECHSAIEGISVNGRSFSGSCHFDAAIRKDNAGIRVRRRFDGRWPIEINLNKNEKSRVTGSQEVIVYVDNSRVGNWYFPSHHSPDTFMEDEFEIPLLYTADKDMISLRLENVDEYGWNEFTYWIYSYI